LQADKNIDYLTMKKVMYSIYEAGGGPINFAVSKDAEKKDAAAGTQSQ
jgi:biopolymer transport protein ExbD